MDDDGRPKTRAGTGFTTTSTTSELVFNDGREPSPSQSEVFEFAAAASQFHPPGGPFAYDLYNQQQQQQPFQYAHQTIQLDEVDPPPFQQQPQQRGGGPFAYNPYVVGVGTAGSNVSVIEEEEEEEEDWESDDDDGVFAYLPPTTADLAQVQPPTAGATTTTQQQPPPPQLPLPLPLPPPLLPPPPPSSTVLDHHPHPEYYASSPSPPPPFPSSLQQQRTPNPNANAFPYIQHRQPLPPPLLPQPASSPSKSKAFPHLHHFKPPIDPKPVESPPQTNSTDSATTNTSGRFRPRTAGNSDSATGGGGFRMRSIVSRGNNTPISSEKPPSEDRDIYTATTFKSVNSPPMSPLSSMHTHESGTNTEAEGSIKMEYDFDNLGIGGEEEEDSVYPEVRASVSNIDDPDMPALTLRMWIVGLFLSIITAAANVFFWFRNPAPSFGPLIALLLSYPMGKFLAFALPIRTFKFPSVTLPANGVLGLSTHRVVGLNGRLGWTWGAGKVLGGWEVGFNPGPWNIKEHVLCYIMANVTVVPPYAMSMIVVSELYYGVKRGFGFNLLLIFATQLTGFGLAGLCRRFLVWPASMVWPQTLVVCTLLNTLHAEDDMDMDIDIDTSAVAVGGMTIVAADTSTGGATQRTKKGWRKYLRKIPVTLPFLNRSRSRGGGGRKAQGVGGTAAGQLGGGEVITPSPPQAYVRARSITRFKFFLLVSLGSFFWFFLPGFLFTGLSIFSWVCWIAPKDVVVNQLFGVASGLGMGVLTFDWTEISWIGSPLAVPWWAEVHVFLGFVLVYWILTPVMYYTNVWDLSYFPMSNTLPYDRFGDIYNVTRVLTPDLKFNVTAYEEYSPLYLPATYAMTYLLAFSLSTCVIVHTIIYHGPSLLNGIKKIRVEPDDIHAKLMRNYPEVPDWWYGAVFLGFFGMAIILVEAWHTGIPVYMLALSLVLPIVYVLPSGFIYAMTGQSINLNIIAQIIPGSILPGNPLVNMIFKCYSIETLSEALSFVQDLKLGHYIKVPPRATFMVQFVATVLASVMQIGVKEWMFANIHDICQPHQKSQLTCPHNSVFFTASAIWGLIGPSRQFGSQSIYHPQLYALIIGCFLPLPFWLWQRKFPTTRLKYVNIPVLINGIGFIPPATGINYSSWFAMGFVFQYLIRRRNFAWWSKFNYVLSAALDCGTLVGVLAIFFFLQWPRGGVAVNWWGNTVWQNTADAMGTPLRSVPPGGIPLRV